MAAGVAGYGSMPSSGGAKRRILVSSSFSSPPLLLAALSVGLIALVVLVGNYQTGSSPVALESDSWDEGWLHRFVHGDKGLARMQQKAATRGRSSTDEKVQEADRLLMKAVGLLNGAHGGMGVGSSLASMGEGEGAAGEEYQPNKASQDRMKKLQFGMKQELPKCFTVNNFTDAAKIQYIQRFAEASDSLQMSYADWTHSNIFDGHGQVGEWRYDRGPPYVKRITMFAGPGVDTVGNGNLVRRILGLKLSFGGSCGLRSCAHSMTGNSYIRSFDGAQMRFLYRNACSSIVIPPLTKGAGPILNDNGIYRLHHYLTEGYNTVIVAGSTASVYFINHNIATIDGGFDLEPKWVEGPYEAQEAQTANTPFRLLPTTLPGSGISVTGVKLSSLPKNAISYYEAEDVSVIFEIPVLQGRVLYLGYDFDQPLTPWVHAMTAATMFNDWNFYGSNPEYSHL